LTRDDVAARLETVMRSQFNQPELTITDTMTAADVAGWDSLAHINFVVAVENAFAIRMTTREVRGMRNVGALIDILVAKTA
jgi:acyl carrier protein